MKLPKETTEGEEKRAKNRPWGRQAQKEQEEGKEWPKKTEEEQQRAVTRKSREKSFLKDMLSGPVIVEKKSPLAVAVWETLVSLAKQFWKSGKDRNKIAAIEEWDVARMGFCFLFLRPVAMIGRGRVGDIRGEADSWVGLGFVLRWGRLKHVYRLKKKSRRKVKKYRSRIWRPKNRNTNSILDETSRHT